MEIPVSFPLDNDGYLRRECPACEHEFKWHHGESPGRPDDAIDPEQYVCPMCGVSAGHDQWFTQAQIEYQQGMVQFHMSDIVGDELARQFRGSKGITFKKGRNTAPAPTELSEPNDMVIVEPPCHPWEPVKVPEERADAAPLYCLICGSQYSA